VLPEVTREIEALLDTVFDELPALMPHVENITEVEPGVPGYAWASEHGRIHVGAPPGGGIILDWDIPAHGPADRYVTTWGDAPALTAFLTAAEAYATLSSDVWDTDADYGYADYRLVGSDHWEDPKGIQALKESLGIPESWFLVKVVNFHDADPSGDARRSLQVIEQWLSQHCTHAYRRVGWSSDCATKVGVAFESQNEAFFFHMRWR
jgi:hypothetical protein